LSNIDELKATDTRLIKAGKKALVRTYGCQANFRDSEHLKGILTSLGYTLCEDLKEADLILLNTCAIRENASQRVFGEIGLLKSYKKQKPDLILGLCGCMAQQKETIAYIKESYPYLDLVFGTHNLYRLPALLAAVEKQRQTVIEVLPKSDGLHENLPEVRDLPHKAWVNIMVGCDKFCTYCVVPYTRGRQQSRPMAEVLLEVENLVKQGYKEITLLGQNVNAYGKDLGLESGFYQLLEACSNTGIKRLRFTTSHPWDFEKKLGDLIAFKENLMPFIHLPVQAGNDEVLKRMGRRYSRESYLKLFDYLRSTIPGVAISTDIIVGFPGESREQFEDTLSLYEYCKFDHAFTFVYSPRANTPATKFEDPVAEIDKKAWLAELNLLVKKYSLARNQSMVDKEYEVLVDGPSKKNPEVYSGYTKDNRLVNFNGADLKTGDLVMVKIQQARSFSLNGTKSQNQPIEKDKVGAL